MTDLHFDVRQSLEHSPLPMIGSGAPNDSLDMILLNIDPIAAKLFEDRNILLADGGTVAFSGTAVTFTQNLRLHVNSRAAGGSPQIIDLGDTTRSLSADGRMVYAVIDRIAGTAVVTDDAATLPAADASNKEVVLIAKRVDSGDATVMVYFRNGMSLVSGTSGRLGASASGGDVTLAPVGASPNANAATLVGQQLNLQPFNSANPGVVPASGGGNFKFLRASGGFDNPGSTPAQALSGTNIDWSTANVFTMTLSATTTFTFSGTTPGTSQTIIVRLTNTVANYGVTWPTVRWAGGSAPTMSPGAVSDVYTFFYDGSDFYGSALQNMS